MHRLRVCVVCFCALGVLRAEQASVGLVFDARMAAHDTGPGHPESAVRLQWVRTGLEQRGLLDRLVPIEAALATDEQLLAVHTAAHLKAIGTVDEQGVATPVSGGVFLDAEGRIAARLAAGSAVAAAAAIMDASVNRAFCAVRPPGHHAGPETSEGFCYFNNVAVAARYLQRSHDIERVLILDWDVHAGNGTYAIFKGDPSVFDFHIHQDPRTIYPGTGFASERGEGDGLGFSANHPLAPGSDGAAVMAVLETDLAKVCAEFKPQFIIISAGFDAHKDDPLGSFQLTSTDFADFTKVVVGLAEQYAEGRVLSVLEGGYSETALKEAVSLHVEALF